MFWIRRAIWLTRVFQPGIVTPFREARTKQIPFPNIRVAVPFILRAGPGKGVDGEIKASSTWKADQAGRARLDGEGGDWSATLNRTAPTYSLVNEPAYRGETGVD